MNKNREKILNLTYGAIIAALYVALSWVSEIFGLAHLVPQVRLSEALCVLAWFTPAAVPGLFIGCLIANLTMGCVIWDVIFGSLATLIGVYLGSKLKNRWLVPIPTVISNSVIVPIVIYYCYMDGTGWGVYAFTALGVLAGEIVSAYAIGMVLLFAIESRKLFKNKKSD